MRKIESRLMLILLALCAVSCAAHGQEEGRPGTPALTVRPQEPGKDEGQKRLLADAEELVARAKSLKANVDATRGYELSMRVVREADQIEKLARAVKDRPKQ